jgi:tetratricopeptide (TPR) repeat protein
VRIGADDKLVAQLGYHRGRILERSSEYEEAERTLLDALALAEAAVGPSDPIIADIANMLGVIAERRGRHADSLAHYERAYRMRVELVGELNARTAVALSNTAVARWNLGDTHGVIDDLRRAITVLERTLGPSHADTAWARRNLSEQLLELGRIEEARDAADLALQGSEAALGPDHPYVAHAALALAATLRELGRLDEALGLADRAIAIGRTHQESDVLPKALVDRATTLRRAGACAQVGAPTDEALASSSPLSAIAVAVHAERGRCALAAKQGELAALELGQAIGLAHARGDGPFVHLPLNVDFARALADVSPVESRELAAVALAVVERTGVRPSSRAELERLAR